METVECLPFVRKMPSCVGTIGNAARPDIRKGALTMIALQGQGPNSEGSEEVLRSFQEWMAERNGAMHRADRKESSDRNPEAYFAPRLDSPEPSINRDQQTATEENIGNSTSVGSRVRRTMVRGFILAALLGLAWQASRDDQAGDMIKVWAQSALNWLSPVLGAKSQRSADLEREPVSKLSDQDGTPPQAAAPSQNVAPSQAVVPLAAQLAVDHPADVQQQLEGIVNDLAVIRRSVKQLADTQEQISRDLAVLQSAGHDASQKAAAPAQTAAVPAAPRKKLSKPARAEIPERPAAAPLQTPIADTLSTDDKPPRPPLPLLTPPAETPSPAQ
jgi:hypothetical protein